MGLEPKSTALADARGKKKKKRKSSGGSGRGADAGAPAEGKRDLFADADEDEVRGPAELQINEKFAQSYERKKRFQELGRLRDLEKQRGVRAEDWREDGEVDSSTSEEEDEDGELLDEAVNERIVKVLAMVRKRDPAVYDAKNNFFADVEPAERPSSKGDGAGSGEQPVFFKDLARQRVLQKLADGEEADEADDDDDRDWKGGEMTHVQEQEALRSEIRKSVRDNNGGDDDDNDDGSDSGDHEFFKVKQRAEKIPAGEPNMNAESILAKYLSGSGADPDDENEAFLRDYVLLDGWKAQSKMMGDSDSDSEMAIDDEEDAADVEDAENFELIEAVEKQREFARLHNFPFEEPEGYQTVTHARQFGKSARRDRHKEVRKAMRERRKARKDEERQEAAEEVKRLKNLKKQELEKRLAQIREVSGKDDMVVTGEDLDDEFDPEKYDAQMRAAFDDEYYDQEMPDATEAIEKPRFDTAADEELDRELALLEDEVDYAEVEADEPAEAKEERRKLLDEMHRLEFEDVIGGGIKTRFKYTQVKPRKFGLTPKMVLDMDDRALRQWVSVKKLYPYRDDLKDDQHYRALFFKKKEKGQLAFLDEPARKDRPKKRSAIQIEHDHGNADFDAAKHKKRFGQREAGGDQPGPEAQEPPRKKKKRGKRGKGKSKRESHADE